MVDGTVHEADVIVYGTGFQASDFLTPMKVVGRGRGRPPRAVGRRRPPHLGITLPGYPNLFLLGPNTNIVVNGSITYFECEAHYIVACVRHLLATGARALAPTAGARRLQRRGRRREPPQGVGRVVGEQLVQERHGPQRPELAVQPPRLLEADPRRRHQPVRGVPALRPWRVSSASTRRGGGAVELAGGVAGSSSRKSTDLGHL